MSTKRVKTIKIQIQCRAPQDAFLSWSQMSEKTQALFKTMHVSVMPCGQSGELGKWCLDCYLFGSYQTLEDDTGNQA